MDLSIWLALMALFLAGGLTPGPAVMMVMSTSLRYGTPTALIPASGVSVANLCWITLAATGIATFAAQVPVILIGLKLAGICFITWVAWTMATADPHRPRARADQAPARANLFGRGVGLQVLNPNALVFFGLLLPGYFDLEKPLITQTLIIMATVTATEMLGLTFYAWLAEAMNKRFQSPTFTKWFNRCAALAMLSSALFAAFMTTAG